MYEGDKQTDNLTQPDEAQTQFICTIQNITTR